MICVKRGKKLSGVKIIKELNDDWAIGEDEDGYILLTIYPGPRYAFKLRKKSKSIFTIIAKNWISQLDLTEKQKEELIKRLEEWK